MSRSAPSFSDFVFRDCPSRALEERGFGRAGESNALRYGKAAHAVFAGVNEALLKGTEVDEEDVKKLVDAQPLNLGLKGKLYDSALWFASEVHGLKPIDVERLTRVEIAGVQWQFKPDAVRLHEDGTILIDEYKTGFVPNREEAKTLVQLQIYALAALRVFEAKAVRTVLWSIKNRVRIPVDWSVVELEQMEPFLGTEAKTILKLYDLIEEKGVKCRKLPEFAPTRNAFCGACPLRFECREYLDLFLWGHKPPKEIAEGGSKVGIVKRMRTAKNLIGAASDQHEDALRAEIMESGGEYFDGGWRAWISRSEQKVNPTPGGTRVVKRLMMEKLGEEKKTSPGARKGTKPSDKKSSGSGRGKRNTGAASSSATSAGASRTRSGKKRA